MNRFKAVSARGRLVISLAAMALLAVFFFYPFGYRTEAVSRTPRSGLIQRTESLEAGIPKMYDIREDKAAGEQLATFRQQMGTDAAIVADIRDEFVQGQKDLEERIPFVKVEYNHDIGIPEVITPDVWRDDMEFLTGPSDAKRSEILRGFIKQNSQLIGIDDSQADQLKVAADYTNPDGRISYAHLSQSINGVPVFRGEVKAGFTKDGRMIRVINNLAPGLDYGRVSEDFGDPLDAVKAAAARIRYDLTKPDVTRNEGASDDLKTVFGAGDWATTAEKMYFPTEPGVARPAWRVLIWKPVNAYYVIVDAESGVTLWHKNIADDQTENATYQVYTNPNGFINSAESPAPLTPGPTDPTAGTQGMLLTRNNVIKIGNEAPNPGMNNLGWMTDGTNLTDGNAVEAGIDRDGTNGVDAAQPGDGTCPGAGCRVFTSTWNPGPGNPAPGDDPLTPQAQRGAVIQMFYVMNLYHDALYSVGFTEEALNFQTDNFGRGGIGGDRISAEGQDSSGTNNANFATPADGGRGRMQMFVWTGPTPDYDGTTDADIIIHEATHGTSNRLHGNGSGLGGQGGMMGEGWSDWYAHTLLAEPSDPINGIYTTGGYATYLLSGFTANYFYGIRRFPKAVIAFTGGPNRAACGDGPCPFNPLTFGHINSNCDTTLGTPATAVSSAFPRSPVIGTSGSCSQVHNAGEIWSSALWEVRALMLTRLGFNVGTKRVLQVVTDGMKLAPLNPTFLQERDAIIAAAAALPVAPEASADVQDVREGFRRRGMGFSASVQSNSAVTEAFDYPNVTMTNPFSVSDSPGNNNGVPEPGENVLLSVAITNTTGTAVNSVVANVNGGPNVSYGTINDGQTVTKQIPFAIPGAAPCGSTQSVTINFSSAIGPQTPQMRSFTLGSPVGLVENFDGVTAPALPAGWTTTQDVGTLIAWATTATGPDSAPNSAFANDPNTVNMSSLVSPSVAISSTGAQVKFRNKYVTESTFDGMVLEISVGGGAFQDIITAGGSFVTGGYNATISSNFSSPIAGRMAWSGTSAGGYITTVANLPASANGQNVQLRWRMATDSSVSSTGVNVDGVQIVSSYNCAPINPGGNAPMDFDGDGKTDVSIFRANPTTILDNAAPEGSTSQWWLLRSSNLSTLGVAFGLPSDILTPGDFTGDGKADIAFFRPSSNSWYVLRSEDMTFFAFPFGAAGDIPAPGNFDGDNKTDPAVFRPSIGTWFILRSSDSMVQAVPFGTAGDKPTVADYDGDGKDDVAVYRPTGNQWWQYRSTAGIIGYAFGAPGDQTVVGDYTGDGKADVAFFRPSTASWYVIRSEDASFFAFPWGAGTDIPAPGDYDGDGKSDAAVFRPSNGTWFIFGSTAGSIAVPFGSNGDTPVPHAYVQN